MDLVLEEVITIDGIDRPIDRPTDQSASLPERTNQTSTTDDRPTKRPGERAPHVGTNESNKQTNTRTHELLL